MKTSWLPVPDDSDFSLANIPFGIGQYGEYGPRPCTRLGEDVVDLSVLADFGYFDDLGIEDLSVFYQPVLNDFISMGKPHTHAVRERLIQLFSENCRDLQDHSEARRLAIRDYRRVTMHMPVKVGNYTDFYASEQHAYNVGVMFRDPKNALLPNWKYIPVGYHGRASSIVVSGTPIHRPNGQTRPDENLPPVFGPSRQVDFELEIGFVIGKSSRLGNPVKIGSAMDHIFGLVLFNDLSARDIQKWEYVPLGPFLSKNFGSVISPWIVTLEALAPFRIPGPVQDPEVLPYLKSAADDHLDIHLEVMLEISGGAARHLTSSNVKHLYWSFAQMLAHHTVNGCNIEVGDIYGSGTISGPAEGSYGSMLEIAWKGTQPVTMPDGSSRKFIDDHDTIIFRGFAAREGIRVGFGECRTQILPALP